jgi:hypothetical protein
MALARSVTLARYPENASRLPLTALQFTRSQAALTATKDGHVGGEGSADCMGGAPSVSGKGGNRGDLRPSFQAAPIGPAGSWKRPCLRIGFGLAATAALFVPGRAWHRQDRFLERAGIGRIAKCQTGENNRISREPNGKDAGNRGGVTLSGFSSTRAEPRDRPPGAAISRPFQATAGDGVRSWPSRQARRIPVRIFGTRTMCSWPSLLRARKEYQDFFASKNAESAQRVPAGFDAKIENFRPDSPAGAAVRYNSASRAEHQNNGQGAP